MSDLGSIFLTLHSSENTVTKEKDGVDGRLVPSNLLRKSGGGVGGAVL